MAIWPDIWRIGMTQTSIEEIVDAGEIPSDRLHWVDRGRPFTFLADPFGAWRDGRLHVFAESYDYRTRHGVIDLLTFDADLAFETRRTVLREPWHLSYPQVIEADGETFMAPEAHRSGALSIYRAAPFPDVWEPALRLELDTPAIDATFFQHGGLWWIAYSPTGPQSAKQGRLHLAYAERLMGPWRVHPGNPVRVDRTSSRPGGTPLLSHGRLVLPMQDCSATYGGAIRPLHVLELSPDRFAAEALSGIVAPPGAAPYRAGMHTLSACGPITLFDVKRIDRSPGGLAIDIGRRLGFWRD